MGYNYKDSQMNDIHSKICEIKSRIMYATQQYYTGKGNPLNFYNQTEMEDIEKLKTELSSVVYELVPFYSSYVEMFRSEYANSEMSNYYMKNCIFARTLIGSHFSVFQIKPNTKFIISEIFRLYENNYSLNSNLDSYSVEFLYDMDMARMIKTNDKYSIYVGALADTVYMNDLDFDGAFHTCSTLIRELKHEA